MNDSAVVWLAVKARDEASAVLDKVKAHAHGLAGTLGTGLKVAGIAAAAGIGALGFAAVDFVKQAMESQKVAAQTEAVLKSTGGAAGMSAKSVADLATSLSRFTPYDDEAIQSAENLLLTFTSIGKDVFPQATETVLNMSTALGQDLKSSAIQLGKAMNDPTLGATALRRVGVALTQQQMNQIQVFQKSGNLMAAQSIIMKELQTEFGGSARAAGDTFGGKMAILNTQIGNVKEAIGLALLPMLTKLATTLANFLAGHQQDIQRFADGLGKKIPEAIAAVADGIQRVRPVLDAVVDAVRKLGAAAERAFGATWRDNVVPLMQTARDVFEALAPPMRAMADAALELGAAVADRLQGPLSATISFLAEHKDEVKAFAAGVIVGVLVPAIWLWVAAEYAKMTAMLASAAAFALAHAPIIALAAGIGLLVVAILLLVKHWDEIKAKTLEVWGTITSFIDEKLGFLKQLFEFGFRYYAAIVMFNFETIRNIIETVIKVVRDIIKIVLALIRGDWGEAWDGVKQLFADVWAGIQRQAEISVELLKRLLSLAWDAIKWVTAAAWGGVKDIILGVWDGIKRGVRDALNWVIDRINDFFAGMNKVSGWLSKIPGVPDIPKIQIPHVATGGIIAQAGLALVGERGPELALMPRGATVMPADATRELLDFLRGGGGRGGSTNYIDQVVIQGDAQAGFAALGLSGIVA